MQIADTGDEKLPLIASLGCNEDMKRGIALLDRNHRFSHEIVGLGHKVVISSLDRDGKYNIPVFKKSGFHSLLAVPIMTYRIHGILGMAYLNKMKFGEDFIQLFGVIANLIGMSLHKSMLNRQAIPKKPAEPTGSDEVKSGDEETGERRIKDIPDRDVQNITQATVNKNDHDSDFDDHARNMRLFHKSHK